MDETTYAKAYAHGGLSAARLPTCNRDLKMAIWLYFILLILEGALRKWIFPGLATPLLIIRDPLALWLIVTAWRRGLLTPNMYLTTMMVIGLLSLFTAIFLGHGSFAVAAYGARILLLHFPLIFVIEKVFNRQDVLNVGKVTLWLAVPMVILIGLQFYSPQTAWVNRGVGGDIEGAGFSGAGGFLRPPGTFSFSNGNMFFFSMVNVFVFYFLLNTREIKKILLICSVFALILAIPLSISRALFFQLILTVIFILIALSRDGRYMSRIIALVIVLGIATAMLLQVRHFNIATDAFLDRFETASTHEGGLRGTLVDRYLGGMSHAIQKAADMPFFGHGIGMGTNVGSMLLVGGRGFLVAEEEWERNIGELGPLLGLAVILVRLAFTIRLFMGAYRKIFNGDLLPWILLSFGIVTIPQGQWAQPTALGFSVFIAGLIAAALRPAKKSSIQTLNTEVRDPLVILRTT